MAARNTTFKAKDVHNLLLSEVQNITPENWAKAVHHVKGVEADFWRMRCFENKLKPIIINLASDDTSSDTELPDIEPLC